MPTTRLKKVLLMAAGLCLAVGTIVTGSSSGWADDRPGRYPGLPFIPCIGTTAIPCIGPDDTSVDDFGWLNAAQVGRTGSVPSKQWARIPLTMLASVAEIDFRDLPPGPYDSQRIFNTRVRAFFTSPAGSSDNYGNSALIPVRTVAFGSIPTTVTLQVEQDRDSSGDPVPLRFADQIRFIQRPAERPDLGQLYYMEDPLEPLDALVSVKVVALALDGVDVPLGQGCETGPSARLRLTTKQAVFEVPEGAPDNYVDTVADPDVHFNGISGGSLHGTIDIPAFGECLTRDGEDVSPILTSAVSGAQNPVQAKVGLIACVAFDETGRALPNPPGVTSPFDPRSNCDTGLASGNFQAVPTPLDLPDEAPEDYVP